MQPGALADDLIQLCSAGLDLIIDQLYSKLILLGQLLPGGGETLLNAFLGLGAAAAQTVHKGIIAENKADDQGNQQFYDCGDRSA